MAVHYYRWRNEIIDKQNKFYNRVVVILFIISLAAAAIGFWGIFSNV